MRAVVRGSGRRMASGTSEATTVTRRRRRASAGRRTAPASALRRSPVDKQLLGRQVVDEGDHVGRDLLGGGVELGADGVDHLGERAGAVAEVPDEGADLV